MEMKVRIGILIFGFFLKKFLSHITEDLPRKARPAFGSWVCRTLAVRVRPIAKTKHNLQQWHRPISALPAQTTTTVLL